MSGAGYSWSQKAKRFRDDATGRWVSKNTIIALRESSSRQRVELVQGLTRALLGGEMSPTLYVLRMREEIKKLTLLEYALGKGGINALTGHDYSVVGGILRREYRYLNGMVSDVLNGRISDAEALNRASMYMSSTRSSFERGHAAAYNATLPEYPPMHPNCRCSWSITETKTEIRASWRTGSAEPCHDCIDLATIYASVVIPKQ